MSASGAEERDMNETCVVVGVDGPAAGVASVDLEIGGFGETVPAPVPS